MNAETSFLREPDALLQGHALEVMRRKVGTHWHEYMSVIGEVEKLYEEQTFEKRELAAYVCSQVFFHVGASEEALNFALNAGNLFDTTEQSNYVKYVLGKGLDKYIALRKEGKAPAEALEKLFQRVCDQWLSVESTDRRELLGFAISSRRLDFFEKIIEAQMPNVDDLLKWAVGQVSQQHSVERKFREQVLQVICKTFMRDDKGHTPSPIDALLCLTTLNEPRSVTEMLENLLKSGKTEDTDLARQLAFELYATCTPIFLKFIIEALNQTDSVKTLETTKTITGILSGRIPSTLQIQLLASQNKTNKELLTRIKQAIESRSSVTHNALVVANSYAYCGTTKDNFLRENIDWLGNSTNWARFTATASLGLIHRGHVNKSLDLLAPYLGGQGGATSPFQEGGALYALGLIHAPVSHDQNAPALGEGSAGAGQGQQGIINYLISAMADKGGVEEVLHGGCLGLGLTAMTLCDEDLLKTLRDVLQKDNAVVGEAAALGIGMLLLGSKNKEVVEELINYGQETQHEKITRGIVMALALIMYNTESDADDLINILSAHKDPIFRQGGVYVAALAYVGTANPQTIERLLRVAVTDVSDDVRRYAVAFLGFLTFKRPKQCIELVRLLSDSHNPNVRYGVALAIGIACAGTGMKEAVEILERFQKDSVDYIKQMAYMALAMVYAQQHKDHAKEIEELEKKLEERIKDKHEDLMTKFGCILATGILEAGGRNCTIALQRHGHSLMKSCVGMALFTQYWYWYPYLLLLSLAFQPTTGGVTDAAYKKPIHEWEYNESYVNSAGTYEDEAEEPAPPEPFEWP